MPTTHPFFLNGSKGRLFCINIQPSPEQSNGGSVLFIPPFGEEMNKSRRMFSQQARRLAMYGYNTLLIDLYGTGDSEGDFGDADWQAWLVDIAKAIDWLNNEGGERLSMISLRTGCLLAGQAVQTTRIDKLVFWQPVIHGSAFLTQFLRLKLVAQMADSGDDKLTISGIKQALAHGKKAEIAGYKIAPELAHGIEDADLGAMHGLQDVSTLHWFEVIADSEWDIPDARYNVIESLRKSGVNVSLNKVVAPPFWAAVDLVDSPELLEQTSSLFMEREVAR